MKKLLIIRLFLHGALFGMCAEYIHRVKFDWIPFIMCIAFLFQFTYTCYLLFLNDDKICDDEDIIDESIITRVEVIDHQGGQGRVFVKHNCQEVELSIQDEGRTLKVFISNTKKEQ